MFETAKIRSSDGAADDWFGTSVSISGDNIVAGATWDDDYDAYAGSAYLFWNCATTSNFSVTACNSYTVPSGDETYTTSGTYYDTISNAAGCDSIMTIDITINNSTTGTDVQTACYSFTWIDGITYTTSNNTATYTLTNASGCDSIVTLDLTIDTVEDVSVTDNSHTLMANATGVTYQWLDCDNNFAIINGETNQSFTATSNGNYAVEITEVINQCTDTSACFLVSNVGMEENRLFEDVFIYPNPGNGLVNIDLGNLKDVTVKVFDVRGQLVYEKTNIRSKIHPIELKGIDSGVYIIEISTTEGQRQRYKLVVE